MNAFAVAFAFIPWKKIFGWLGRTELWLLALLKPLGAWGILGLSILDSAAVPLIFLDPLVVSYSVQNHAGILLYCLMGAVGSAIGSMAPYYVGRAGGELFLLKRINRERYERLRDRFERQEFLAIMLPAMCPPPMPVKIFELAAGVLEMRPVSFFLAVCAGKFLRFLIESLLVILYGPQILSSALHVMRRHSGIAVGTVGVLVLVLAVYVIRKIFDRRKGVPLPLEEPESSIEVDSSDAL